MITIIITDNPKKNWILYLQSKVHVENIHIIFRGLYLIHRTIHYAQAHKWSVYLVFIAWVFHSVVLLGCLLAHSSAIYTKS